MTQRAESAPATPLPSAKERRRLREAKSLTQEQVAAALGVTRETVASWESGRRNPKRGAQRAAYAKLLAGAHDPEGAPGAEDAPGAATEPAMPGGDAPGCSPQGAERDHPEQTDVPERPAPEETPRHGTGPEAPAPAPASAPAPAPALPQEPEPEQPPALAPAPTPTPAPTPAPT
ncbi:helix-turn-helix transcriptional regulator, partial [Streptomyces enissocaesilis]|uniref:helix-turn-helix transcriptional regulator n=1 Tax=Streptomyces enissocaesilis TaxID=332589 RepID=UPI0031E3727A